MARLDQQYALDTQIRGGCLTQALWAEMFVGDSIAIHFAFDQERRLLLGSLVLDLMGFAIKVRIFGKLLQIKYPEILKQHPNLLNQLDSMRILRNRMAHSTLDTSDEWVNEEHADCIRLVYNKDGQRKKLIMTLDDVKKKLADGSQLILALMDARKEIHKRRPPDAPYIAHVSSD
jgi:hypothetical protein